MKPCVVSHVLCDSRHDAMWGCSRPGTALGDSQWQPLTLRCLGSPRLSRHTRHRAPTSAATNGRAQATSTCTCEACGCVVLLPLHCVSVRGAHNRTRPRHPDDSGVPLARPPTQVKLVLSQGATGHALVMSRTGDILARGSEFPADDILNATNQHTSPTVGLRRYESHFSATAAPRLSRGCYVLVSVRGHGSSWMSIDGGTQYRSFRSVPAPPASTKRAAANGGSGRRGGGGASPALRARNERRRRETALKTIGRPSVSGGEVLGARVMSVFAMSGQPLAPAAMQHDIYAVDMQLTVTYCHKPVVHVSEVLDASGQLRGGGTTSVRSRDGVGASRRAAARHSDSPASSTSGRAQRSARRVPATPPRPPPH